MFLLFCRLFAPPSVGLVRGKVEKTGVCAFGKVLYRNPAVACSYLHRKQRACAAQFFKVGIIRFFCIGVTCIRTAKGKNLYVFKAKYVAQASAAQRCSVTGCICIQYSVVCCRSCNNCTLSCNTANTGHRKVCQFFRNLKCNAFKLNFYSTCPSESSAQNKGSVAKHGKLCSKVVRTHIEVQGLCLGASECNCTAVAEGNIGTYEG